MTGSTPHVLDPVEEAVVRNYHARTETDTEDMSYAPPAMSEVDAEREVELALIESVMVS